MRTVTLPGGEKVPAFGLGTWHMGERGSDKAREVAALKAGLDLGVTLIDTAEMYGEGGAEEVVAEAVAGRRDKVFIVSKVYPHNASRSGAVAACETFFKTAEDGSHRSLSLHWRGSVPLAETVETFEKLKSAGKIRHWGVSNLDVSDMAELARLKAGAACASNQVLYHLGQRSIEWDLLPDCQNKGISVMAYSPLGQGRILGNAALKSIAAKHGVSPAAIAVAWTMRHEGVISIPKSSDTARVAELVKARDVVLTKEDLAALDAAFPPPKGAKPLPML